MARRDKMPDTDQDFFESIGKIEKSLPNPPEGGDQSSSRTAVHETEKCSMSEFARPPATWVSFGISLLIHLAGMTTLSYLPLFSRTYSPPQLQYARGDPPLEVTVRFIPAEALETSILHAALFSNVEPVAPLSAINLGAEDAATEDSPASPLAPAGHSIEGQQTTEPSPQSDIEPTLRNHPSDDRLHASPSQAHRPSSTRSDNTTESDPTRQQTYSLPLPTTMGRQPTEDGIETGLKTLNFPKPKYPTRSKNRGEEGVVLLGVEVLADGRAGRIRIIKAPPYPRLVQAAVSAVREASFVPATENGRPVRSLVNIPFQFRLR